MKPASLALFLVCLTPALAQEPPKPGRRGIAPALDSKTAPGAAKPAARSTARADVDASIRRALDQAAQGDTLAAIETLRAAVHRSGGTDAKARYQLARLYAMRAKEVLKEDPTARGRARELQEKSLSQLRHARRLRDPENVEWADHALERLHEHARRAPELNQYDQGGSYPGGYCGPTALRMALRLAALDDPGADAVALQGAAPYVVGEGSDGGLLAQRARELGLTGARFSSDGRLEDVVASIDDGRPVLMTGGNASEPALNVSYGDGTSRDAGNAGHYMLAVGYERDERGEVTGLVFNDPARASFDPKTSTKVRGTMTVADVDTFFAPDGDSNIWMVTHGADYVAARKAEEQRRAERARTAR